MICRKIWELEAFDYSHRTQHIFDWSIRISLLDFSFSSGFRMDFIEECMESVFACFNRRKAEEIENNPSNKSIYSFHSFELLDDGKLDKEFEIFVEECGLSEERQADLKSYSREKKLIMLNTHTFRPEEDCRKLITLLRTFEHESSDMVAPPTSLLQDLVITLRTQCSSFVEEFVSLEGVHLLSVLLLRCQLRPGYEPQSVCLLGAFRALLNSKSGRVAVLQDREALLVIARAIDLRDCKCKILAVEILSGLCFLPEDGHQQVLNALTQVSSVLGERTRFQTLINELHRKYHSAKETDRVRITILGLINALLRTGHAERKLTGQIATK
ncbi:diaphanous GTPase-binding domain protein [Dictyocaulus viviparus]|uniref:Diaphanous GTPase-binding domain protein n=1 Tax=Dictyocaulus viviparus TaxID=29172 RepID=A0A0D8YA90_DICVI|nr:diaphanous GTPase-binding domain protein [Dictyocaulus viviparus]